MYIDDEELRGLYKTSAAEHIQAIAAALMQLEAQPQNLVVLKDLLRSAHTLKGDSRMLGVEDVETLVHQIEECLMPIEKGQARMTSELFERLYSGLNTIEILAHTAVTGEANDVNMFYVLATLMGDGGAAPTPKIQSEQSIAANIPAGKLFGTQLTTIDLDDTPSDGWISTADSESLFDTPADLWIHESDLGSVSIDSVDPLLPSIPSQLQASFLELASELFPLDATLPTLDFVEESPCEREAAFSDFTLIPGTGTIPDLDLDLFDDDSFALITNIAEIAGSPSAPTERASKVPKRAFANAENELFADFDDTLVLTLDDLLMSETATLADLPTIEPIVAKSPAPVAAPVLDPVGTTPPVAPAGTAGNYQIDTIRVEAKQLDALMGQSGEINVINQQITSRLLDLEAILALWENSSRDTQYFQTLLQQIPAQSPLHQQLNRDRQQWEQMGALISKFKKSIDADSSRLDLVTSALESGVKKLRLLPFSTIFNLFPRMVRDLAKTQSKEISFAIEGGDFLLDKRLLEEIKDPLMHLLRNAIDHGIETPTERQQNGKLAAATLLIQVRQTGNQTTIEILDDGRGLDLQRIKATAIKRGLHTQAELDLMTTERIQSLIFESGFSTRTRVTELSGRGVGLDIVRTNVERIKGSVDVESSPDRGCTFRIVLSHAIGSSQVMMVDVREQTYAIPVEFVDRMLLVNKAEIFALGGTSTTQINGQTITVAWLADLLSLPAVAPNSPGELTRTSNSISCLLLQSGRQKLALLVDRIQDRQLVTIESPHPILKNVPHLAGSTILGTGEVCLILNPLDLLTTAAGGNPLAPKAVAPTATPISMDQSPTILLVEDSLVIRTQMTRILKGAGYQVTTANDGLEGWEKLQAGRFDLVVSDVEMPRWGGLELTTQIRNHPEYQHLPVILVTTLSQAVDRDRGLQAGANAYLTKGDFDQQLLLDTLTRLI
jgi:two-component system, chemotaxis family, sensor kinase CheA